MIKYKWLILIILIPMTFYYLWQLYDSGLRPWHLWWGNTESGFIFPLPGDEGRDFRKIEGSHGIMINGTPEEIWPWIVQIGAERGGWYSYSFLENLVSCGIKNADRIMPEYQNLKEGDVIKICTYGPELIVREMVPNEILWLEGYATLVLIPSVNGVTKLLIRPGTDFSDLPNPILNFIAESILFEPMHFIMESKMLDGIKQRVEGNLTPEWQVTVQSILWLVILVIGIIAGISVLTQPVWWKPYLVGLAAVVLGTWLSFWQPTIVVGFPAVLWLVSALRWSRKRPVASA